MIQRLVVDVGTEADVVPSFRPVDVHHRLVLIVAPVVGHEGVGRSEISVRVQIEERRAAFVGMRAVGAGQAKPVQPLALTDVRLLDAGIHAHEADMRVHHERVGQRVAGAGRDVVRVSLAGPGVAAAEGRALQVVSEIGPILGEKVEDAEAAEHVQFGGGVPIELAVDGPPVQHERRLHEVVVGFRN